MITHKSQAVNEIQSPLRDDVASLRERVVELEHANADLERLVIQYMVELEATDQSFQNLQQNQALLRGIIDHTQAAICVKDIDGTYLLTNHEFNTLFQLHPDQIIGKHDYDFLPSEIADQVWKNDQIVRQRKTAIRREELIPVAGMLRTYVSAKFPLYDDKGELYAIAGISTDITERKHFEETLRLSQFTLDHAADGVQWVDPDGRHIYVNEAICNRLGYTREELLTMRISDIDSNIEANDWETMWNTIRNRGSLSFETLHLRKDTGTMPVEVTANHLNFRGKEYICAFVRDITERKLFEEELRTFKTLVENAPVGIGVSSMDGTITYANTTFGTLTGYADQLTGMNFLALYNAADLPAVQKAAQQAIEQGLWQGLLPLQHADGSTVQVQVTSFIIRDIAGQPQEITAIFQDLTEQQRLEQEQADLQQRIIEAQRASLRELSSPLIPIAKGVVVMPLIGAIDSQRAQDIMEALLEGVAAQRAHTVILDITGVQVVDTQVANSFIQSAQAVKLLGARAILTGIQPQIAQTLVQLGVDLSSINTRSNLQAGIASALQTSKNHHR